MGTEATVTQADRNAAADLLALDLGEPLSPADQFHLESIRSGQADDDDGVQAFARHREAHSTAASQASDAGGLRSDVETILAMPVPLAGHWDTEEGRDIASECITQDRRRIAYGDRSDMDIANAVFMVDRYDVALIHYQTAAKERIRWLSAQLALANHRLATLTAPPTSDAGEEVREAFAQMMRREGHNRALVELGRDGGYEITLTDAALSLPTSGEALTQLQAMGQEFDATSGEEMRLREALEWYAEQVAGCRKVGSLGRPYQENLDADGGKRARAALAGNREQAK